jgi:hypothetical protein
MQKGFSKFLMAEWELGFLSEGGFGVLLPRVPHSQLQNDTHDGLGLWISKYLPESTV